MRTTAVFSPRPSSAVFLHHAPPRCSTDCSFRNLIPISQATAPRRQDGKIGGCSSPGRRRVVSERIRKGRYKNQIFASVADVSLEQSIVDSPIPRGDMWSVHKFGGTCMGTSKRIQSVADIILSDSSERKLVVVSAMSKVTDTMYDLVNKASSRDDSYITAIDNVFEKHMLTAKELLDGEDLARFLSQLYNDISNLKAMLRAIYIAGHATESFSDFVVGHGELWSAQMLSYTIKKHGKPCCWMDTRDVLIVNPTSSNQVDPDYTESERRLGKWFVQQSADIIIATGFIASTPQNIPTTLKRDGSDFSAAILGALVRARQVTIWTDVDGVYSADPRKVSEAVILRTLSYQEAWEMSYFGANVLHPRTIIPVMNHAIPILIRNIFNLSAPGTMICQPPVNENGDKRSLESVVKAFATIDNLALVNVEGTGMAGVPGTASAIFGTVKDVGANVIMISQASSEHSVCFAVPENEVKAVSAALHSRFRQALEAGRLSKVEVIPRCSILATVGQKMASTPGVSATLFDALAKANINVRAIAQGCSEYNITVVLKQEDCVRGLRAAHSRFYLSKTTLAMGIIGPGLIGGTLLDQLRDQAASLKEKFNIDLRVMGITGSRTMVLSETGIDLSKWREILKEKAEVADLDKFAKHVHENHFFPNTVLVDCTADTNVANNYYDWLRNGIHVITPNKKANSGPLDRYLKLRMLQRLSYTHYFYEATVGAGLPIISTLRGLLETGDKILHIEGIFSGTLSYIFNNFEGTRAFSEVVSEAKEAGYTEPDPRDDLSGTDVARKVIILARESGLKLELSDIPVQSLVPEPLRACSSPEEFMLQLPNFDKELSEERDAAEALGEVLRYVGVVDAVNEKGRVELRRYKREHPFAQLSGSDNIIAFTTTRYKDQPLIVRGPGAGAEVTAGGVFSDILRLASYLGDRRPTRQEEEAAIMAGISRLCNLIAVSLRPYLEPRPFPLTKESEKDLLVSLSRVHKQIQQWTNESDCDGDQERIADSHFYDTCYMDVKHQFVDENNCFMDITSTMVAFLGLESGFVQHLVGKIFVGMSNLLAKFRSKWLKLLHLLWVSLGLAMSSRCILPSAPLGSIHVPDKSWIQSFTNIMLPGIEDTVFDISIFIARLQLRVIEFNVHMVAGLFHTFRNILKSLKREISDLEGAYRYLAMSSLLKMPWGLLDEIHVSRIHFGKDAIPDRKNCLPRSTDMLAGIILQLLCSLVEQKDLIDVEGVSFGDHAIYTKFSDLVLKLLACFFKHLGCYESLSGYLKHKTLVLMVRLRLHMQCDVSHLVFWLKLLKNHFEDLLYAPISVCDDGSAATLEESPFLAVSVDRDMVQNLCTQHLRRQTIFLFLHCCFKLVHFHHEADHQFSCGGKNSSIISTLQVCSEHFTCMGLVELFEWLQKCSSLENVVDYESFRKSCFSFGSSFLQFYMEEDDMLFDILLLLLDAPVISLQVCSNGEETSFEEMKKDIIFNISSIFNPIYLFHMFLLLLHYDHLVLVDYLLSKDLGIRFLQYLLRCLRMVGTSWHIFLRFPICGSEQNQSSYKRRKISIDESLEALPSSIMMTKEHKVRKLLAVGNIDKSMTFNNAKECLLSLKKTVEDLHRKNLFPYNPKPLLRRFAIF
ncbi:unnamed protein product [Musa acuminata subsp. burmannicoides]